MRRQLACIWKLKRCLLIFSLCVAGQRIRQSVTQLEDSQKRRGGVQWLFVHGQSDGGVGISSFNSAFYELRGVEYGRERHLDLACDVLFKEDYNGTNLCIYLIPINIF